MVYFFQMCKLEVSNDQEFGRRTSFGNVSFSPNTSPSASSSYSRDENSSPCDTKPETLNTEATRCVLCDKDCSVKEDVLSCRYCAGY